MKSPGLVTPPDRASADASAVPHTTGVPRARPRHRGGFGRDGPDDFGGPGEVGQHPRIQHGRTQVAGPGERGGIVHGREGRGRIMIERASACQLICDIAGPRHDVRRFFPNFGFMVSQPPYFGACLLRTQDNAAFPENRLPSQFIFQLLYFLCRPRIDAVEDRRSKGLAASVDGEHAGSDGRSPDAGYARRVDAGFVQQLPREAYEIFPPQLFGVVFRPSGPGHGKGMARRGHSRDHPLRIDDDSLRFIGADVYTQIVMTHFAVSRLFQKSAFFVHKGSVQVYGTFFAHILHYIQMNR